MKQPNWMSLYIGGVTTLIMLVCKSSRLDIVWVCRNIRRSI